MLKFLKNVFDRNKQNPKSNVFPVWGKEDFEKLPVIDHIEEIVNCIVLLPVKQKDNSCDLSIVCVKKGLPVFRTKPINCRFPQKPAFVKIKNNSKNKFFILEVLPGSGLIALFPYSNYDFKIVSTEEGCALDLVLQRTTGKKDNGNEKNS